MDGPNSSWLTLRCLKPYLVFFRALGLIPVHFESEDGVVVAGWSWKRPGWKLYTLVIVILVIAYEVEMWSMPSPESGSLSLQDQDASVLLMKTANSFCFAFNVTFTLMVCFLYLGRRLGHLIQRMVGCEKELAELGCHLRVRQFRPVKSN